jgi:GTP-binding protein Era
MVAKLAVPLNDLSPDFASLVVANRILGGDADSRLFERIRVREGLSYGVGTQIAPAHVDTNTQLLFYAIFAPQNLPKVKGGEGRKARNAAQIILIDTPGVHRSETSLDRKMAQEVRQALDGCDLLLVIADVSRKPRAEDEYVFQMLQHTETPAFLLLNKIDLVQKDKLLPMIDEYRQLHNFREIVPISALKKNGLNALLDAIVGALPQNPPYFPQDQLTDQPLRFLAAEIIREQVLLSIGEEVPYATTVIIERFEETPKLTRISAAILCERDGQKGILIGKGGSMLKKIGTAARLQIEQMLHGKVFLELFVKVRPGWREEREFIDSIDWRRQLEDMARQQMPKEE